jgi:hypothetical protein
MSNPTEEVQPDKPAKALAFRTVLGVATLTILAVGTSAKLETKDGNCSLVQKRPPPREPMCWNIRNASMFHLTSGRDGFFVDWFYPVEDLKNANVTAED